MKELIEKYQKRLSEMQTEFDEAYENQYCERCDELDEGIDV